MKKKQIKSLKAKISRQDTDIDKKIKISLGERSSGSSFSGSSYNAKGIADHGKMTSNKKRR
jgi:hypothetical protein